MNTGVTTIRNYSRPVRDEAKERARALALPYIPREGTLEDMAAMNHMEGFLIYGKSSLPSGQAGKSTVSIWARPYFAQPRWKEETATAYAGSFLQKDRSPYWMPPLARVVILQS